MFVIIHLIDKEIVLWKKESTGNLSNFKVNVGKIEKVANIWPKSSIIAVTHLEEESKRCGPLAFFQTNKIMPSLLASKSQITESLKLGCANKIYVKIIWLRLYNRFAVVFI